MYKTDNIVKQHLRESSPYKLLLRQERLLENFKSGSLFGYVQNFIEVPENLRECFANFPPIIKNINVGKYDIGPFMEEYGENERLLIQPRRMLISSFFLENGTIITPLRLFYLVLGFFWKNFYRFVQYAPMK